MNNAFRSCLHLTMSATDAPDLSHVTNMGAMFYNCSSLDTNTAMNTWDTSNVIFMNSMFQCDGVDSVFNQDISNWDTSSVTNMKQMFFGADAFNQDLRTDGNKWDVSKVTSMDQMFLGTQAFDGDITNRNTSKVTNMHAMFGWGGSPFNQDIS